MRLRLCIPAAGLLAALVVAPAALAQTLEPPFDVDYSIVDLGPVPDLPAPNGGLAFLPGDPHTLLIAGNANDPAGMLYSVGLVRDVDGRITGFAGSAVPWAQAPQNDGGVAFSPDGVLFLSRYPNNELGQLVPGSLSMDRVIDLAAMGVAESPGGLNFVPQGFPGAGELKLASYDDGGWYTIGLAPDGTGTYDVTLATRETTVDGGPEGFVYVPAGSPVFTDYSQILVSEWSMDRIAAYFIDDRGNPIPATRTTFISDVGGPLGAAIDPITGDFLFSTFTLAHPQVLAVRGFAPPPDGDDPPDGECGDPDPRGPGYWHRQCMSVRDPAGSLGLSTVRGPSDPLEAEFESAVMPCVNSMLTGLGFGEVSACEALDATAPKDPCRRALRRLTTLAFNVCSGRMQENCPVDERPGRCDSATVGGLINETAGMIHARECYSAMVCATTLNGRVELIDRITAPAAAGKAGGRK